MKKVSLITLLAASLFLFAACDSGSGVDSGDTAINDRDVTGNDDNGQTGGGNGGAAFKVADVTPKELPAPVYGSIDPGVQAAATGANDFAFRLGRALIDDYRGKNFVVSPFSVWMPLAALANVSADHLTDAHLAALGAAGVSTGDVNTAAARMLYDLTTRWDGYNPLSIVNAVFVDNKVTLQNSFAQNYMDYYRGGSINVDFSSRDAVDAVNRWAEENTNGLIRDLIEEFDPATIVAIANAIYFSDRWSREFNPDKTEEGDFHAPEGKARVFYMLSEDGEQDYYEDDGIQAVNIQFSQSGSGLYILLPKSGGAEELFSAVTADYFNKIQKSSLLAKGKLLLPRFSIDNTIKLEKSLQALGIPLFQNGSIRDLVENPPGPMKIGTATQKALIEVDEKGTTAAAVTILQIIATSAPIPVTTFEMICDKPFMFILYGRTYEGGSQVLFTGIVNQP